VTVSGVTDLPRRTRKQIGCMGPESTWQGAYEGQREIGELGKVRINERCQA
jgi:hypothetical protein